MQKPSQDTVWPRDTTTTTAINQPLLHETGRGGHTLPPGFIKPRLESSDGDIDPDYILNYHDEEPPPPVPLIKQLTIPTPTYDQLVEEVKGIYAGLVSIENKVIEVHKHIKETKMDLTHERWLSLFCLHKSLLQEHYDFYLVTDYPTATSVVRRLPEKYNMPARMWKYAIHIFLELMRENLTPARPDLPGSREYLIGFLYSVCGIVTMLHETVKPYDRTWTECLGDLSRYRMAIEEEDTSVRDVWCNVSKSWYRKTIEYSPTTGRLYHHMAILSRPNPLAQIYFYTKSLCTPEPFKPTHESIMTLFTPMMEMDLEKRSSFDEVDCAFVAMHGHLFQATKAPADKLSATLHQARSKHPKFLEFLRESLTRNPSKWTENGMYIALSNICALYEYKNKGYLFCGEEMPEDAQAADKPAEPVSVPVSAVSATPVYQLARSIFKDTLLEFLSATPEPCTYSFLQVTLLFLTHLAWYGKFDELADVVPWASLVVNINRQMDQSPESRQTLRSPYPRLAKEAEPLPDDYNMRGFLFCKYYYPDDWFRNNLEEAERLMERQSMRTARSLRIISLVHTLSFLTGRKYILYDSVNSCFSTA